MSIEQSFTPTVGLGSETTAQVLRPLGDKILVRAVKPDVADGRESRIVIPETVVNEKTWATYQVVRLGTKREKGPKCAKCGHKTERPFDVKEGDYVAIKPFAGIELKMQGVEHRIVTSDELMGVYV
jgi:co-chaperonin GroES (HSP10)